MNGSLSIAKDIAARFTGIGGLQSISEMIRKLLFIEGDSDVASQIAASAIIEHYDTALITQGAADTEIFFILAGSVTIVSNGRDDGIIQRAPAYVGEMATIDCRARRCVTVSANERTVAARISEPDFSRIAPVSLWNVASTPHLPQVRYQRARGISSIGAKVQLVDYALTSVRFLVLNSRYRCSKEGQC